MLNGRRIEVGADLAEESLARVAIVVEQPNLQELVRVEVDVDFMQHRGREAAGADGHDRVKMMRLCAKHPSCGRGERAHPPILSRSIQ